MLYAAVDARALRIYVFGAYGVYDGGQGIVFCLFIDDERRVSELDVSDDIYAQIALNALF